MTAIEEWRRHWPVVLGSALAFGSGFALFGLVSSLFIVPLSEETGWTRGQIATASSVGLIGALAAPFVGRVADRYGARRVAMASFAGLALVYCGMSQMRGDLWVLFALLAAFSMTGVGTGGLTMTRGPASWFVKSRGLALAATFAGVTVTALVTPPIIERLIDGPGWRWGYALLAGLCVFVAIPAIWFLVHERHDEPRPDLEEATRYPGTRWRELARDRNIWGLGAALFIMNAPGAGIVTQLAPMLTDNGLSAAQAAWLLSALAVSIFFGRLGAGFLLDRLEPRIVAAVFTSAPALGCLLLAFGDMSFGLALTAVVLIGMQQGSETDLLAFFTVRQFGLRRYSSIYGTMVMVGLLGTGLGVAGFGLLHDSTGSYDLPLLLGAIGFPGAAACFLLLSKRPFTEA